MPKKDKVVYATLRQGFLFSQIFKPITTARRPLMMKGIACSIQRKERRVDINIVDRAYLNNRNMERGESWVLSFGVVALIS